MREGRRGVPWLLRPLNTLPLWVRALLVVALTALATESSFLLMNRTEKPSLVPDANQYLRLAKGQASLVPQPFASRPLAPALVRGLARVLHTSIEVGFLVLGLSSLAMALVVVLGLATRSAAPRWLLFAMVALALWPTLLHDYVLPDLFYAAVLCCLLLCLAAEKPLLAALTFFPLMLSRESTSLTLLCFLIVGWKTLRVRGVVTAVAASAAGAMIVRRLSAGAAGNPEHLPQVAYLAAKIPWNLVRTFGVDPWSNLYPYLCRVPSWQHSLGIGPLHAVGVCRLSPEFPQQALFALLTTFGLLTPLLFMVLYRYRPARDGDVLTRFCLLYGGVSFLLAPMLGTAFQRLFGYAWPLFLVALPRVFPVRPEVFARRRPGAGTVAMVTAVLAIQVALTWVGTRPAKVPEVETAAVLELLGTLVLLSGAGASLRSSPGAGNPLQRGKISTGKSPEQADFS